MGRTLGRAQCQGHRGQRLCSHYTPVHVMGPAETAGLGAAAGETVRGHVAPGPERQPGKAGAVISHRNPIPSLGVPQNYC